MNSPNYIFRKFVLVEERHFLRQSLLIISFILTAVTTMAQLGFEYSNSIPVKVGANELSLAWSGGINYAQFSNFDYDYDGDLDLFVFDRSSNNIKIFSQESTGGAHYEYVYNANNLFPDGLRYRATLVDYDQDGKKDLFTYSIGGLKVYRNVGNASIGLQWELYQEYVYSQYPSLYTNLYVSASDIPAIVDVDSDGDLDILTFHIGGSNVEYHQNQSMDLYGVPDSLIFELRNECWGKFKEDVNTNSLSLNETSSPCEGSIIPNPEVSPTDIIKNYEKHAGSTILALDYNNSGVLDLIIGDVAYTNLNLLINGGTVVNSDSPMISVDNAFPSNTTPSFTQLFPASFYLDVDFDNVKDLIVCPNAKNVSFNEKSVQFYKNLGTDTNPNFIYSENDFLQNEMVEHGTGTIPVFSDYNQDGLIDLFVGNFFRYKPVLDKESTIAYYQNTGTANAPEFTFIDDDIFNLASENFGFRSVPAFGDVDNDGDDDLFIGREDGTLIYYENTSSGGNGQYDSGISNYQDNTGAIINVTSYASPQLFDINGDGLLDLIIGKRSGEIVYYKNIGTVTSPSFTLENNMLGNIDLATEFPDSYATPHLFNSFGKMHLFVGSSDGTLIYYDSIEGNIATGESFNLVSNNFANIDVDAYSSFAVTDLDNDGKLNMIVGQDLGGLYHFEVDPNSTNHLGENKLVNQVLIYPNPVANEITVQLKELKAESFALLNTQGQILKQRNISNSMFKISLIDFPKGIYFIQITSKKGVLVKKVVKK